MVMVMVCCYTLHAEESMEDFVLCSWEASGTGGCIQDNEEGFKVLGPRLMTSVSN